MLTLFPTVSPFPDNSRDLLSFTELFCNIICDFRKIYIITTMRVCACVNSCRESRELIENQGPFLAGITAYNTFINSLYTQNI